MTEAPARDQRAERSGARRELVENELYEQSARLFAQKGFAGTSISDIASAMGISRQALYYYVKSKDELLEKLVREMIEVTRSLTELAVHDPDMTADQRLLTLIRGLALAVAERPFRHRLIAQSESMLVGELEAEHLTQRRRFHRDVRAIVESGQREGVFRRDVDAATAALTVTGMCNWMAWWAHTDAARAQLAAEQVAQMAMQSILDPRAAAPDATDDPQAAVDAIKNHLLTIEIALNRAERPSGGRA